MCGILYGILYGMMYGMMCGMMCGMMYGLSCIQTIRYRFIKVQFASTMLSTVGTFCGTYEGVGTFFTTYEGESHKYPGDNIYFTHVRFHIPKRIPKPNPPKAQVNPYRNLAFSDSLWEASK